MPTLTDMLIWLEPYWLTLVSVVIGLAATYFVYRWQKKEKLPFFAKRSVVIVKNAKQTFPQLTVHYKGHGDDLDNLTVAVIAFWNGGKETINGTDMPTKPLTIKAGDGHRILGAAVIQHNNEPSRVTCTYSKSDNAARIDFAYLDYMQGCVIEVFHTGSITIEGAFKGAGEVKQFLRFSHFLRPIFRFKLLPHVKSPRGRLRLGAALMYLCLLVLVLGQAQRRLFPPEFSVVDVAGAKYLTVPEDYDIRPEGTNLFAHQRVSLLTVIQEGFLLIFVLGIWWLAHTYLGLGVPSSLTYYEDHLVR